MKIFFEGINIVEFQYGKIEEKAGYPVIGFEATELQLEKLNEILKVNNIIYTDVTSQEDIEFRMIHYNSNIFHYPWFIKLEFPERAGALRDFLKAAGNHANICYFNYLYTGERVGRALLGFEFTEISEKENFKTWVLNSQWNCQEISESVIERMIK